MRNVQIESWAISILDRLRSTGTQEDVRVELKAAWIEPQRAARRLAAQANSSQGEPFLWVIGAREDGTIQGASTADYPQWLQQLRAEFDGLAPSIRELLIPVDGQSVVALYVEPDRVPYVVRNPAFGSSPGVAISHEIPWRDGTTVRSARREDLLRLLAPLQTLPSIELLDASVFVRTDQDKAKTQTFLRWDATFELYLVPLSPERVVIPYHRCLFELTMGTVVQLRIDSLEFTVAERYHRMQSLDLSGPSIRESLSVTIHVSDSELVVDGPGSCKLKIRAVSPLEGAFTAGKLSASLSLLPVLQDRPILLSYTFPTPTVGPTNAQWHFAAG